MPKVTKPLFSGDVRGQFGKLLIFTRGGVVRRYFKPRNPKTEAQQAQREAFKEFIVPSLTQEQADLLYAAISHLHDDRYSQLGHDHDGSYSPIGHDHDSDYLGVDGAGHVLIGLVVTVPDDDTYSFTPPFEAGSILIQSRSAAATNYLLGFFVVSPTPRIQSYVVGSNVELLTGVMPSPTAGTDGRLCISLDSTSGMIYIRNRTGASRNIVVKVF
jgi:hypothetical protein